VGRGARVAFCAREVARGGHEVEASATAIAGPGRALAIRADVSREGDVGALFDATLATFGRVDVAVNNAGTSAAALLVSSSASEWDRVAATNLTGPLLVAQRLAREVTSTGRPGSVVTIGSIAGNGVGANASYAATKGALVGLTRGLAAEYGRAGLRANLVVAGYVETDLAAGMTPEARRFWLDACPQRRAATPSEVARVALFLASRRARHLNGQALYATAGLLQLPL
jgi:3-oxoacyl-[acyl-carrier protein] reductase